MSNSFNINKSYVIATNGILPALDAHLLTNLPSSSAGSSSVDNALSSDSQNPVQNKVIKQALDNKINNPVSGNAGQFLSKTNDGVAWADITPLNYLLFKIPIIEEDEYYHLYIQFSMTETFDTYVEYDTENNTSLFKAFTGLGMSAIQSSGLNYIYSNEILQLDIRSINSVYKFFRFHWTNDDGQTFGMFNYGNRQAIVNMSFNDESVNNNEYGESYEDIEEVYINNTIIFANKIPIGIKSPAGKFYSIEKQTLMIDVQNQISTLDFTAYMAYEDMQSFSGVWRVYFNKGPKGDSVSIPIGSIIKIMDGVEPPGFLECDGTAVSRTLFANLFNVIGTTFGSGDGSTTFNVPNLTSSDDTTNTHLISIIKY